MNVFTVIGIIGISIVVVTLAIAYFFLRMSQLVTENQAELEFESNAYKPNQTLGFKIAPQADPERQFKEARLEAARRAASLPRGANVGIGRLGEANLRTASRNLENDPISTFKIAKHQGWNGLGQFEALQQAATAQAATAPVATGPRVKRKLVPGKDYPIVEITDGMGGEERRKARIANAKSKAAAMKALKAAGADTVAAPAAGAPAPAAAAAAVAQPTAAALGIEEPKLIEITEGMDPNEMRKARIANAKATSA